MTRRIRLAVPEISITHADPSSQHPVLDRSRRRVFAHRGGAALRPENTMTAFDHGLALGADGLELDVRLSRDGQVVVVHDATLERTTDGVGAVSAHTWRELAAVDAGYRFAPARGFPFRGRGCGIPRLTDVFDRYADAPLIIEMKGTGIELADAVIECVVRAGAAARVCLAGFDERTLRAARERGPGLVTSASRGEIRVALYASWLGLSPPRRRYQALQVPERYGLRTVASRRFIRAANRAGLAVQIWTVDDGASMLRLLGWGALGVITDRPDVAVPVVAGFNSTHDGAR
jgi:glycerophosphoryl diester phosphodiesterase